jgi:hypothetical protein
MMANSTQKAFGRKQRLDIWKHFSYNSAERKTQCTVLTGDGDALWLQVRWEEHNQPQETLEGAPP